MENMASDVVGNLGTTVLAVGALGVAAFGIVEGFKGAGLGLLGFGQIRKILGAQVFNALRIAYGDDYLSVLKVQYRTGRSSGDLTRNIRQGARIGLTPDTAEELAKSVGVIDPKDLIAVAEAIRAGEDLNEEQVGVLGRYELALDARIDAATAMASYQYANSMRVAASVVAVVIALAVAPLVGANWLTALVVGVAAVPIAPIAKDLATAIQSASAAMSRKR